MENKTLKDLIKILTDKGVNLIGCTQTEIDELESFYSIKLPKAYKEFLFTMGKDAGEYLKGSDCFYNHLFSLKNAANGLLGGKSHLLNNTFVFWMHQGYQFCFFYLNEIMDPQIYYYNECYEHLGIIKIANTLTEFLYYYPDNLNSALKE